MPDFFARARVAKKPPAFATGLAVFLIVLKVISLRTRLYEELYLTPGALWKLDFNRLSFFPVVQQNSVAFVVATLVLIPVVAAFELANGTVRTGVVLNAIAALPGLIYCLIASLLRYTSIWEGSAVWTLALVACLAWRQSKVHWSLSLGKFAVPVLAIPVALLAVCIALPGRNILGNLLSYVAGIALGTGWLNFMIEPPGKVIEWIEHRIRPAISLLSAIVLWTTEPEARELRADPSSVLPVADTVPLGTQTATAPQEATTV